MICERSFIVTAEIVHTVFVIKKSPEITKYGTNTSNTDMIEINGKEVTLGFQ